MFIESKTLIEFCNSNSFTDTEEDSDEEITNDTVCGLPHSTIKSGIVVDVSSTILRKEDEGENESEWENIELSELADAIFDCSFSEVLKEKQL
jgi:hypothetical protein|tara:strand:+ start:131 stop:409 length:279 start_codon:yes stop_codon:yes gene_type:complete